MFRCLHHPSGTRATAAVETVLDLPAETEWMAGGALAAAPEDVPAVVLPYGLDRTPAGSCQGFDAWPSGTVWERGLRQHQEIVLSPVSANRNLHLLATSVAGKQPNPRQGAPRPASIFISGGAYPTDVHERLGPPGDHFVID